MAEIKRTELFGKLDDVAYKAIESATVFCKVRGNPYVELVHWMNQIINTDGTDIHLILRHFEADASRLSADLTTALDRLPRGATSIRDFSPQIELAIKEAWMLSTLLFKWCVELNMMGHTIAAHFRADPVNRRELRAYAVDEVKRTNGKIRFDDALDQQRRLTDDT